MEPQYHMQFSVIGRTLIMKEVLPLIRDTVVVFNSQDGNSICELSTKFNFVL